MKIFRKLREVAESHREAMRRSELTGAEADAQAEEVQRGAEVAEALLRITEAQAQDLARRNTRNHYSESLTHAFRGRTA